MFLIINMPSPIIKTAQGIFYKRKDGAWIRKGGKFVKVGKNKYKHLPHYSKHIVREKGKKIGDYYRKATIPWGKDASKKRRRYPQAYD